MRGLNAGSELSVNYLSKNFAFGKLAKVVSIQEKFSNHFFFDPAIDKETSVPYSDILNALSVMDGWGYLSSTRSVTRYCVECFTMGLSLVGRCPFCGSTRIRRGKVISHKCGYRGFEELYRQGEKWICPKCQKQLYMSGADYKDEGMLFKCMTCGNIFDKYATYYQCPNCHAYYEEDQAPSIEFVVYEPTAALTAKKPLIANSFRINERVAQYLTKIGYEIRLYYVQETNEELIYWDLLAKLPGEEEKEANIGVSVLPLVDQVDDDVVEDLITKKKRAGYRSMVVITPALVGQEMATKLSEKDIYVLDSHFETLMDEKILAGYLAPVLSSSAEVATHGLEGTGDNWNDVVQQIKDLGDRLSSKLGGLGDKF
jgi:hypothetical protein